MGKLIVLKLDGDFKQGFRVALEIGLEGDRPETEIMGKLPPATELTQQYSGWQSTYRSLGKATRIIKAKRAKIYGSLKKEKEECRTSAKELRDRLNSWLRSESFFSIREKWLRKSQHIRRGKGADSCQQPPVMATSLESVGFVGTLQLC
jgi:hypothetical protein